MSTGWLIKHNIYNTTIWQKCDAQEDVFIFIIMS